MKAFKHIFIFLFSMAGLLGLSSCSSDSELDGSLNRTFEVDGIVYKITGPGSVAVAPKYRNSSQNNSSSTPDMSYYNGSIVIPEEVSYNGNKFTVVAIGEKAFSSSRISDVTIPPTVTEIGDYAFQKCHILKEIELPESVTVVRDGAFYYCSALKEIKLSESLKFIGNMAFASCAFTEIDLPESVETIDKKAFASSALESIKLPTNLETINDSTFINCKALKRVILNQNLKYILDYAFYDCQALAEIIVSDNVIKIGDMAFARCRKLMYITLGKSLMMIGGGAFSYYLPIRLTMTSPTPPKVIPDITFSHQTTTSSYSYDVETFLNPEKTFTYVEENSLEAYKNSPYWKNFALRPIQE